MIGEFGRYVPHVIVTYNDEVLNGADSNTETEVFEESSTKTVYVRVTTAAKTLIEAMDTWR